MSYMKMLKELNEIEYRGTFGPKMIELKGEDTRVLNIWPYVQKLVQAHLTHDYIYKNQLIETVYRNVENTYDHILLPTDKKNAFVLIVVDLNKDEVYGHYFLDLNEKYGLE